MAGSPLSRGLSISIISIIFYFSAVIPFSSGDDIEFEDDAFASFFDEVIIPSSNRRQELDPRISVSKYNASDLRVCASSNKRILDADHRLIIIGGGPAGLSAAVYAARAEMNPLVISRDGGQLESSHIVDNYPGFENGVDTIEFIQKLTSQAERFGAKFLECDIKSVDIGCRPFRVECHHSGAVITSSAIVVATGATAKWLSVPGEAELLSRGVHTCATCDGFFYKGKHAAVIGGGDTAMEQALFLARMAKRVTVIHRRDEFRASKAMATRVLNHPNIDILWNTMVLQFQADPTNEQLESLLLAEEQTMESMDDENNVQLDVEVVESVFRVDGVFVAIGHVPNTQLFDDDPSLRRDDEGYIYTIPGSTVTSVTGVYAAGDVADHVYRQAITSAGTGAMAAMDAERWLCEHGC